MAPRGIFGLLVLMCMISCSRASRSSDLSSPTCGGRLKGPYGIIQTPNFPHAFPVPLKCKWIISHEIENGTISIYFTQQYVTSGLTFTEYTYYDETRRVDERRAFTVTEENITRVKFLQVQSPVLVVELGVGALEGSQLRALGLLAVFGLNVTYAVLPPPPRRSATSAAPRSCSALECRLLGDCKVTHDYQKFYCECYEGYSGVDCGEGPLCARAENRCKHGGVCRQMGPAAVSCVCAPGYTGVFCESHIGPPECGLEECSVDCDDKAACDCNPRDSDSTSARFETTLLVTGQGISNISQDAKNELTTYLKASNISLEDEIQILAVSDSHSNGSRAVRARIWSSRREAGALRAALARLSTRTRTDRLRPLAPAHFEMQPALSVHALTINQRSEVWEGSEFILSCTAYGSPGIIFTWYKDGVNINFNGSTRDLWTRTVTEDALGRRISVLGVSSALAQDSGRWSCAADDAGRRRCRALWLTVLRPPDVRLLPSTITVNKGDNVSITCLTDAVQAHGALGFSWTRERFLMPLVPGREVWEDLYPAGSVLKLFNVQKSGEYRCQVSSIAGTNAKAVQLWALAETEAACESSAAYGLRWPRTAPGAHAKAACPHGHTGETTRFCEPRTGQRGVMWQLPDFSGCIADSLKSIYARFTRISYGYSWEDVASVCQEYGGVLRSIPLHPGAGTIPLQHTMEIIQYLRSTAASPKDRQQSVPHLFRIIDILLKHPDAFLDEENTYQLQNALVQTAGLKYDLDEHFQEFSIISKPVQEDNAAHFRLHPKTTGDEEWLIVSAGVELIERSGNASVVAAQYNNLASRLPSLKTSIEYKDTREIEYLLTSQQVQLSASGSGVDTTLQHSVTLLFTHVFNYSAIANKLACGIRTLSEPRTWSTKACELRIPESRFVSCRCRGLGTYALFSMARSSLTDAEKDLRGVVKITVGVGGALCMIAAALQLLGLFPSKSTKMPIILKAATAAANSAALFTLLECDTRQEEACAGALGWVCAACWCCGCAALCAQPLLLQAELAGRTSHASSVGLLAGVCILAWLTARLWGGAPLQLGSAAQIVCSAGCALLIILCFGLAVCAALRIKTITHKVPAERRTYLKDRLSIIRHTLLLLLTTTAAQAAGVAYVQPDARDTSRVIALATAAIVNGITMVVCYVIRDEDCIRAMCRALSLSPPQRHWKHDPTGDTSLSLYIKQSCEVDSRGGVVTLESTSQMSPITSYWRAPGLESPARINRRMSTPDTRADIVRCVEYADCVPRRRELDAPHVTTRGLCDLVTPCTPRNCVTPLFALKATDCVLCACSNPDVSAAPKKSCLKKSENHASSMSLPPMEVDSKAHIEQVNRDWNKAYQSAESPDAEKVLIKISSDLDFLLNRSQNNQEASKNVLDQIEEVPT